MELDFKVTESGLSFKGLEVGTIKNGQVSFDFDVLRQIVIRSSRFVTGRKVEDLPLKELLDQVGRFVDGRNKSIDAKDQEIEDLKRELHNRDRIIESYQDRCDKQNIEIYDRRQRFIEAARALEELKKEA